MRTLPNDWDGEGAEAPRPETVESAIRLMQKLQFEGYDAPDRLIASLRGRIVAEWHPRNPRYVEVEISDVNRAEWMVESVQGTFTHLTQEIDLAPEVTSDPYLIARPTNPQFEVASS